LEAGQMILNAADIDLLIEPSEPLAHRIQAECRLLASLFIKLRGRKVDVLIKEPFKSDPVILTVVATENCKFRLTEQYLDLTPAFVIFALQ
jgi:hypothetical protein